MHRFEDEYENSFEIYDYKDVLRQAWIWRQYWQISKRIMLDAFGWYHKEIPIVTPKQVEPHIPSTATTLVNDGADHLAGNDPSFLVKPLKESQKADEDRQRVQTCLNAAFSIVGHNYGYPVHRSFAIHGGWSGMMCARVTVDPDWDPEEPSIEDIRWEIQDPRFVYPDPGSLGRKAVIIWRQASVGEIRMQWPDWEGYMFSADGFDSQTFGNGPYFESNLFNRQRSSKPLSDNMTVSWIEYWDSKYKCFIANGIPVMRDEEEDSDLVEHGLGFNPYVIRPAGYADVTGEAKHKFPSMISNVFSELETEAALITQLKWIVQETAWPIYLAPKDTEGEWDLEPGSLNFIDSVESIKAIRALREDAIEPKAILSLLHYIKEEIERATYPVVLKGEAPGGVRAGYPIAILSTQAKLKFSAPASALRDMFREIAEKTLAVVKYRFKVPTECIDGYKLDPKDFDKYFGRIDCKLDPQLPQDLAAKLPLLEFLLGSAGFSKADVIRELGYENPEQIRELRAAEDLEDDPRVRQVMVEHLIQRLSPEAAAAVEQIAEPNQDMQKMQEVIQQIQGQIQLMQMQQQYAQLQGQAQAMQQGASMQGPPQFPQGGAPTPGGPPPPPVPPTVPGGPGGTFQGQNLANPGMTKAGPLAQANPDTAQQLIARQMRASREISNLSTQNAAYGDPQGGGL